LIMARDAQLREKLPANAAKVCEAGVTWYFRLETSVAESERQTLHTRICELFNIDYPIALGGMSTATSPGLVAAVSNAGGVGTLGFSTPPADQVATAIGNVRALTTRTFAVNFLLFGVNDQAVEAALAQRPTVVSYAWAWSDQDLRPYVERAHAVGAKVTYMV